MKRAVIILAALLSGCTVVDAYLMAHFDSNEYQMITTIRYDAHVAQESCGDPARSKVLANDIAYKTGVYRLYEGDIAHNDDSIKAAAALDEIAVGLKDRYNKDDKVSQIYCKLKFGSIENSATLIQHVQGNRPR